jgi:citrate lyase subunit beta/citryl-CoA lyase
LAAALTCEPDGVLAPKVSSPADVEGYATAMEGHAAKLWLMIETCAALFQLDRIAQAAPGRLTALVMGTNDLAKEMRCAPRTDRKPLWGALAATVAAARANRLGVLDGVSNALEDGDDLREACAQGVEFGFDGKTLIHPAQIPAANAAFSPAADTVAWAHLVVAAFERPENAERGAIRLEGKMVERLHLEEARQLLAVAAAISAA